MTPAEQIAAAYAEYAELTVLAPLRDQSPLVPGSGPLNAPFLVVGEAPGAQEVTELKPFVGPAGQYLNEVLAVSGVQRRMCYVTNVVLYRPPGNRTPEQFEIASSRKRLMAEILAVRPGLVISLGATARHAVNPLGGKISEIHGKLGRVTVTGWPDRFETWWLPTFHPAAALRSTAVAEMMAEDLRILQQISTGLRMVTGS
jgi:uracil-DNA glycosylase